MATSECWCCGKAAEGGIFSGGKAWCVNCKFGGDEDCYCGSTYTICEPGDLIIEVGISTRTGCEPALTGPVPDGTLPLTGDHVLARDRTENIITKAVITKVDWDKNLIILIPAWGDWRDASR